MKSARRSYFGPAIIVALTSLALLACDGLDHMTEQEMHETTLTCEEMFGPEECQ